MAFRKRQRVPPTEEWHQLTLLLDTDGQRSYEMIRPVVVFGEPVSERAQATRVQARTIYRTVARFEAAGLSGLEPPPKLERHQRIPQELRQAVVDLKREHPPLHLREIATICWARFGHRLSHTTVRRILAEQPLPPRVGRRFPPYHTIADPFSRRRAVLQLHYEGWSKTSIAGYLEVHRHTVEDVLRRWVTDDLAGLHDKPRRPHRLMTKHTLETLQTVKALQANPLLGAFRVMTALKQLGIDLSPRTCGRILALNRKLYGLPSPTKAWPDPKAMPFAAQYRHHVWSVDVRYLDHRLGDFKVYCIAILDNYSRVVLASEVSRAQDLSAYLRVLRQALARHGAPTLLVSDSGSIFLAKQALQIYTALGIQKAQIERQQPWQNYIETLFNVQRRMADWHFAQATTWEELVISHDQWVSDYNTQEHWAHQQRDDGRRSPAAVLDWVHGWEVSPDELAAAFAPVHATRRVDRGGYVRFRHWRLYGERGLAQERVAVWLTTDRLVLAYSDEPLAQYGVTDTRDRRQLRTVVEEQLFRTPFQSAQAPLWQLAEGEWLRVLRLPPTLPRRRRRMVGEQLSLVTLAD